MRRTRRCWAGGALLLLVAMLTASAEGRTFDPIETVPSQTAAAVYVQEWGQVLWGLVTSQTGTQPVSFGDPVFNEDGSISQSFTAADGTEAVMTFFPDGSAQIDLVLPDGDTQTILQSPPDFDGVSRTTTEWHVSSSRGLSVDYVSVVDDQETPFDIADDTSELAGTAVLPDGVTQTFTALTAGGYTDLESMQSDGSTFTLSVPLMPPDFLLLDFSQPATGTYADSDFALGFTLVSTPLHPFRWAALLTDLGDGITGTFSLNSDFSGFGQLEDSSVETEPLAALVSWTQYGDVEVYLLSGQDLHMGPAGAALDFLRYRWLTLTALLAPAPGASALSGRTPPFQRTPGLRPRPRSGLRVLPGAPPRPSSTASPGASASSPSAAGVCPDGRSRPGRR
jgi:hypothetical protein